MRGDETIIIGGGISGLSALHRLANAGKNVVLLERNRHVGGAMRSVRVELQGTQSSVLIEQGPNTIQSGNEHVEQLIHELGLTDQIVEADKQAANRYVLRNGSPVSVPTNPKALIESPLLSMRAKLRLLREPFVKAGPADREESVADFVERRLGREPLDYGVNPFVSGVFAGRPEHLSLRYAFPIMYELEQEYGSLIRGGMRRAKQRKQAARSNNENGASTKRRMFSFRDGMASLPKRVHEKWSEHVLTECTVIGIEPTDDGWNVRAELPDGLQEFRAKNLLLATNAFVAADLTEPFDAHLAETLRTIEYPPVAVASFLVAKKSVAHPLDGFGLLCPEVEGRDVLGIIFTSSIFPERAPEDTALLTVFVGGARSPQLALQSSDALVKMVGNELQELLGVQEIPILLDLALWPKAIPQYNLGYGRVLDAITLAETRHHGLTLMGNYRNGISVPDCIGAGMRAEG